LVSSFAATVADYLASTPHAVFIRSLVAGREWGVP
jgi:hypothetical protein